MSDWSPSAELKLIRARAELYAKVRDFFAQRQVLEVETPVLSAAAVADPHLHPMSSSYQGPGHQQALPLFLQTSPEYPMKRLLAAGSGAIYQICKSFRNGESGGRHNPEFTMLEWYRPGFDHQQLMEEVEALVRVTCGCGPARYVSYRQLFLDQLQIDPHSANAQLLQQLASQHLDMDLQLDDRDSWLDLLFSHLIEPQLLEPTFVFDFPETQAALAQIAEDELGVKVARRFELFVQGTELANGYLELTDADEQARRFESDQQTRQQMGLQPLPVDHHLLAALQVGMPACAGVALGMDRLLMIAESCQHIDQVLAFPLARA